MKIVVVGANGNVGSRVVGSALASGNEVVAYVRRPETVSPRPGLTVAQGDAADSAGLAAAAQGADAVVVSITGSMKDATFMQRHLPAILDGVRQANAGRVVLVSVFGAGDTAQKASGFARLIYRTVLRKFLADKAAADHLLVDSGLGYTIVYPVNLKDAPEASAATVKPLDEVREVPGLPTLPYPNAGAAIATIATDPAYAGQRVLLTSAKGWKSF
ncbi:NAD(P)-binding oxidoreductase [Cellulomonas composti]|nr:NAD(P)-binding oxidoreductase [Cellulomonas composti]